MGWPEEKEALAAEVLKGLYEHRMIRTFFRDKKDGWTLISGLYSPLYIQLRPMISYPRLFHRICSAMARLMEHQARHIDRIVGIAMAGVPLAAGMALQGQIPACFTRKIEGARSIEDFRRLVGSYGEHGLIEGEMEAGENIAVVDDLVTRFDSKLVAMEQVKSEVQRRRLRDIDCSTVVVVVDREQGGGQAAQSAGVELLSLIPFKSWGLDILKEVMDPREWKVICDYLGDPDSFQSESVQVELKKMSKAH